MELYVHVAEARDLPSPPPSKAAAGAYAKVKVGVLKSRTRTVTGTPHPVWNEEFVFRVEDEDEDEDEDAAGAVVLKLMVYREGGSSGIGGGAELMGRVRIQVERGEAAKSPAWFSLQPRRRGTKVEKCNCGKILLTVSCRRDCNHYAISSSPCSSSSDRVNHGQPQKPHIVLMDAQVSTESETMTNMDHTDIQGHNAEKHGNKNGESLPAISQSYDRLEFSDTLYTSESPKDANCLDGTFEDAMEIMETRDESGIPENLQGGILLEQRYRIEPKDLNSLLYKLNSQFRRDLAQHQGAMDYEESPWRWTCKDNPCLSRFVTYTKAATKLVKAVKAVEEQVYLKADGQAFAILNRVNTPDVPYGNCFQILLLYKITPGPELSSGEKSSCLTVSWDINFHQNTIMKTIIEGTARQGLKETYASFAEILLQYIKPLNPSEILLDKEQLLAPLYSDHQSGCKLFMQHFCNLTVCSTILVVLYVVCHILLSEPSKVQGLEFDGLDLPDSFLELIAGGILFLQLQHVLSMISHFVRARLWRGNDHGVRAHGDGWILTIALMEGRRLPSPAPRYPDPYVVFSCNGKSRTSSVQLQTADPQWNEILEFDAMEEPPSVLDIKVFSFDGPFDQEIPLGHAEINFLKHSPNDLANMWIPLEGKLADSSQSKLHIRIFVDNKRGDETIHEYIHKMEKEVGEKMISPSSHKNLTFQKLFGLPPEEFLIHEFSCCLKRKLPLQGKIFLSARIFGFYANLFGYKTKFFFLWEDIECIQEVPKTPSLTTVGSPALVIVLRNGRGLDARHGAKSLDDEGRLKFQFQSFASFNRASRTIMALWRTKSKVAEQHAKLEEDYYDKSENSVSNLRN
ncbi:C2 and GRAM domain-containing protein [Canna indica]|uniref:C2 and GRAM domain-containing protein n=1 Tax=Canna indica TaxID=4628 RepID=A0AAQ3KTJ6_9LILI|nr:C2 and GRAM domain-containing protein [Canna indica]